jgi:hypothetical protein
MPKKQRRDQGLGHKNKRTMQGTPSECIKQLSNFLTVVGPEVTISIWAIADEKRTKSWTHPDAEEAWGEALVGMMDRYNGVCGENKTDDDDQENN